MARAGFVFLLLLGVGCGGGTAGARPGPRLQAAPLLVTAGMERVEPAADAPWAAGVDLVRLGVARVDTVYDLSTPAGQSFVFDLLSRNGGNTGAVQVSMAHAADDGLTPVGGAESLAEVGVVPSATGAVRSDPWFEAQGDGFARVTVRGSVVRDQVLAVRTEGSQGETTALVRVRIGPASEINVPPPPPGGAAPVLAEATLYSSDSWQFGLPTVAVSGDRTSVVVYEGDRGDPNGFSRYEMRLQYDEGTGAVTGGGVLEPSPDTGNWRDHEIAALFNVLALASSGQDVTVKLSFDRGATFAQTETLSRIGNGLYRPRLVQVAMAADYTLAVLYWKNGADGSSELLLAEGKPSAFDGTGSPTRFAFDAPVAVYRDGRDVAPVVMGAAYSDGGDLVVGYGFSRWESLPDGTWVSTTQFRCAVRMFGGTAIADRLVEEDIIVGKDPSVALVGQGPGLRIFYAYEARDGVRLRTSADAGRTFSGPVAVGSRAAHLPTVFAREQGDATRVDVLYLAEGLAGTELHLAHWDDYDTTPRQDFQLTEAKREDSPANPGPKVPGALPGIAPDWGSRTTQVGWLGYDAVLDGDDILVVYDEQTYDAYVYFVGPPEIDRAFPAGAAAEDAMFVPAEPPPLAPGLTEPLPAPDPDHMHQLKWIRLD